MYMYACICISMYVCLYDLYVCMYVCTSIWSVCMYVCMHACIFSYLCVQSIHKYTHTIIFNKYIYTWTHSTKYIHIYTLNKVYTHVQFEQSINTWTHSTKSMHMKTFSKQYKNAHKHLPQIQTHNSIHKDIYTYIHTYINTFRKHFACGHVRIFDRAQSLWLRTARWHTDNQKKGAMLNLYACVFYKFLAH